MKPRQHFRASRGTLGACLGLAAALHGAAFFSLGAESAAFPGPSVASEVTVVSVEPTVDAGPAEPAGLPSSPSREAIDPRPITMASKSAEVETHPGPSADSEMAPAPLPELSNDSVLATTTSPEAEPFRASDALLAGGGSTPDGAAGVSNRDGAGHGNGRAGAGSTALGSAGALSHGPRLVSKRGVCRGLFPHQAMHESGSVTIAVEVTPEGAPLSPHVTAEVPRNEGFAQAARDCVPRLHFEPATDATGRPIASASKVRLSFVRSL